MKDLLIEIGTEELPAGVVEPALEYLAKTLKDIFHEENIKTYGTPRRLVLHVKNFTNEAQQEEEVVFGPPWKVAFTEDGKPTKALEGFLKRYSADPSQVFKASKGKGEYVALKITKGSASPLEMLKDRFEELLTSIPFPKRMRWTSSKHHTFSRPIRWILALYGEELIDLSFGEVRSDKRTKGHRFLGKEWIEVSSVKDYFKKLEENGVLLDQRARREKIESLLKEVERELSAEVVHPEGLLDEVNYLVEYPFAVVGSFEEKFLDLPDMVIITVSAHHQRFFCLSKNGKITNKFIGISNNKPKTDHIRRGYEKVIRARLEDALFFYREDLKTPLEKLVPQLSQVLVHPKIGSMLDKVERLKRISHIIAERLSLPEEDRKKLERAVYLSKADLLTNMVKELDELQGYMGYIYALKQGEEEEVARAIYDQYKPRSQDDELPESLIGAVMSVVDKSDDLLSFFSVGEIPKGGSDPYGLRRSAFGLIRILEDRSWDIDLRDLASHYEFSTGIDQLESFLAQRLESYLDSYGYDIVRAVLSTNSSLRPYRVIEKVKALAEFRDREEFTDIYEAYRRVAKILPRDWEKEEVKEELLKEPAEIELWERVRDLEKEEVSLEDLAKLRKPIDRLFDEVLIMDKDKSVKDNRLSLLKRVKLLFNTYADFSEVTIQEVK